MTFTEALVIASSHLYCPGNDSLIISSNNSIINMSADSLLQLNVILKNESKRPIRNYKIYSNSRGEVCLSPIWSMIITKIDSNQENEPPLLLCHGVPESILRKNDEYRCNLKINFKWVFKPYGYHFPANHDFGEYTVKLILRMKTEIIESNTIHFFYKENLEKQTN